MKTKEEICKENFPNIKIDHRFRVTELDWEDVFDLMQECADQQTLAVLNWLSPNEDQRVSSESDLMKLLERWKEDQNERNKT